MVKTYPASPAKWPQTGKHCYPDSQCGCIRAVVRIFTCLNLRLDHIEREGNTPITHATSSARHHQANWADIAPLASSWSEKLTTHLVSSKPSYEQPKIQQQQSQSNGILSRHTYKGFLTTLVSLYSRVAAIHAVYLHFLESHGRVCPHAHERAISVLLDEPLLQSTPESSHIFLQRRYSFAFCT
jgi:hypothetical protein